MTFLRKLFRRPAPEEVTITIQVSIFVEPDEGGFHAFNPAFKGLHVDGPTEDDAINNFLAVLPAYVQSLVKHGEPLPVGMLTVQRHQHEDAPDIRVGAFMRHITMSWPTALTSGIN
jgi:predicted RNase H-like HicB family nuclease